MSHTPGPWKVSATGNVWSSDTKICEMSEQPKQATEYRKKSEDEHRANAYLIAASPCLLEALKRAHTWLQGSEPGRAQYLGEVIAKAEEPK